MNLSLEAHQITFRYAQENVLEGLSLEINQGDFVSIIGPNGSGKSTLLKNITAEFSPQEGVVLLENQDIFKIKKKNLARKMAVVPQETAAEFSFSVWETVLMGRMPHQKRFQTDSEQDLAITRRAMELSNVWHLKDRLITELSGGEKQRVIVARALAQEPQILLLDEPTSHLDLQHQLELLELLQSLNQTKGLTVIAVLHDLNLAAQFSQKIILLNKGRIVAYGDPAEVLTSKNILESYHIEVAIAANEITGRFNIIPLSKHKGKNKKARNFKIHLLCGGGSGVYLMEQLHQAGYSVSCGVLNIGDSDWKKAKELQLEVAEEAPFAPIGPAALQVNADLIQKADVIIVLPVPFGTGNLANLQQTAEALRIYGKRVLIVAPSQAGQYDFTGGEAEKLLAQMAAQGALCLPSPQEILESIGDE
ncbi:MAG: heme ABC transporter ATP-binding protein [Peptococcaceae bacterium]|nr:heme ABC transporter ATP-binding protein [Peptococcaceae bacterium]